MHKIIIKRVKAWNAENAPYVWGIFNTPKIFDNFLKKINENVIGTDNLNSKFYYNNIDKFWYTKDKTSLDFLIKKIKNKFNINLINNIF